MRYRMIFVVVALEFPLITPSIADSAVPPRLVAVINVFRELCLSEPVSYDAAAARANTLQMSPLSEKVTRNVDGASERSRVWKGTDFEFYLDERISYLLKITTCNIIIQNAKADDVFDYLPSDVKPNKKPKSTGIDFLAYSWMIGGRWDNTMSVMNMPFGSPNRSSITIQRTIDANSH